MKIVLGNLILVGGIGLLTTSFFIRKKQNHFKDLYEQIQKCQKFHLDFVDQLGKLPTNSNIILFGSPKSQTNKQKILYKSIIKRGLIQRTPQQQKERKEFQVPKEDRLWKFSLKEPFYLQTLSNQKIIVEEDQNSQLYAYNLMRRNSNEKWEERVIVKGEPLTAYGKLINLNGKVHLKTNYILGTKNQSFLSFLDNQIMNLRSRGKILTIAGAACFGCHAVYKHFFLNDVVQQKKTIVPSSEQEKILDEIKKFEKQKK